MSECRPQGHSLQPPTRFHTLLTFAVYPLGMSLEACDVSDAYPLDLMTKFSVIVLN